MKNVVTLRLDDKLKRMLDKFCRRSKRKRGEVARDILRRQLSLRMFEQLQRTAAPFAKARGYLTDKDVFRVVS